MTRINLGIFSELVNDKADKDLRNVDLSKTDIVIEYQEPTEENNYTWYRLYASGWVEQGGFVRKNSMDTNNYTAVFPITMQNLNFTVTMAHLDSSFNSYELLCINRDTTYITLGMAGSTWQGAGWQVSGKADMTGHEILPSKKTIDEYDHRVIAFQKPTTENNYTWYRKYADGWVEQGGRTTTSASGASTITLLVEMQDTNYCTYVSVSQLGNYFAFCQPDSTTQISVRGTNSSVQSTAVNISWQVSGMYK